MLTMLVSRVWSWVTRLPGATRRSEMRPDNGAVTRVKPRFRAAASTAALAARRVGGGLQRGGLTALQAPAALAARAARSSWVRFSSMSACLLGGA